VHEVLQGALLLGLTLRSPTEPLHLTSYNIRLSWHAWNYWYTMMGWCPGTMRVFVPETV
jgi:hypothetical protein